MDKKIVSMLLALCMLFTVLPSAALAEVISPIGTEAEIIAFEALAETEKIILLGVPQADLELPEDLVATVKTTTVTDSGTLDSGTLDSGTTSKEEKTLVPVTWICEAGYNMDTAGVYTFRPVISGYTVSAVLPEIAVTVGARAALMMPRTAGSPTEVSTLSELQTAIDNAAGDLNLKLSDSYVDSIGTLTIEKNFNFTLDLNGKTRDGGDDSAIVINCSGTFTITDSGTEGTITAEDASSGSGAIAIAQGNLVITGGTVRSDYCAIYNNGSGEVTISGGVVRSTKSKAIYNKLNGTVNLTGGLINSNENVAIYTNSQENGKIKIPSGNPLISGEIQAMNKAPDLSGYDNIGIYGSGTSTTGTEVGQITKDDIDTDAEVRIYKYLGFWPGDAHDLYTITFDANNGINMGGATHTITAGRGYAVTLPTSYFSPPDDTKRFKAWAIGSPTGVLVYAWDDYMFMADTTVYAVWEEAFAEINGTSYLTLQKAVDAVKEGETIKLLSDIALADQNTITIPSSKPSFTIDLNGKTLDSKISADKNKACIVNMGSGTLTITDSSPGGTGKITSPNFRTVVNAGSILITGGTIENVGGGTAIDHSGTGSVTVTGGTVRANGSGTAINTIYNASGSINVSGGTVSADGKWGNAIRNTKGSVNITGGLVSANLAAIQNKNAGKITISGNAKLTSTNGFPESGTIILEQGTADDVVLEITGGLIENSVWGNAIHNLADGKVVIPSGTPIISGKIQAINKAPDLSRYVDVRIMASKTDASGINSAVITKDEIDTDTEIQAYQYLNFGQHTAPASYIITYHTNGGSGTMANGTVEQGQAFTLPNNGFSAPEGRRFKAWAMGSASGPQVIIGDTYCFTADTTVYAVWEDIPTVIVAEINGRGYDTLQKAFDAVTEGQTIKLCSNIVLKDTVELAYGKPSFTLDLNGKTVDGGTNMVIIHNGRCTLTVVDSKTGGKMTSALPISTTGTIRLSSGHGNLVIAGGTVENTGTHGRGAIFNEHSGYVRVEGGTVRATNVGILNGSGSVIVSGGTVSADAQGAICNNSAGSVTVSGGTVSAGYTSAIYNEYAGKIIITGDAKITSTLHSSSGGTILLYRGTEDQTVLEI
ncbi:MAG: Peptidoglycan-binding lysin domain protein, partial [Oscillospiraceae bacterium]|nr:Peptidoglycan-binding lysin domain protein [Oscillospiraceae bacterium]